MIFADVYVFIQQNSSHVISDRAYTNRQWCSCVSLYHIIAERTAYDASAYMNERVVLHVPVSMQILCEMNARIS